MDEVRKLRQEQGERLRLARERANYRTAKEFSDKHGFKQPTYINHETGKRSYSDKAAKYAALLGNCDAAWLLTGVGQEPPGLPLANARAGSAPIEAPNTWFWGDDVEVIDVVESGATPLPGGAMGLGFRGSAGKKIAFPMTRQLIEILKRNLTAIEKELP